MRAEQKKPKWTALGLVTRLSGAALFIAGTAMGTMEVLRVLFLPRP